MATGQRAGANGANQAPVVTSEAPRRPSLALQPFAWGGLQILPIAASAVAEVAVVPPPWPGMHRTPPFRIAEYDQRCRAAVAALETAMSQSEAQTIGNMNPDRQAELDADLDLSDLAVLLPPGTTRAAAAAAAIPAAPSLTAQEAQAPQLGPQDVSAAAAAAAAPEGGAGSSQQPAGQEAHAAAVQGREPGGDSQRALGPMTAADDDPGGSGRDGQQPAGDVEGSEAPPAKRRRVAPAKLRQDACEQAAVQQPQRPQQGQQKAAGRRGRGGATRPPGEPSSAAVGDAGAGGGSGGGDPEQQQQQEQGSQLQPCSRQEMMAWWQGVTAAGVQLECLRAVLQAPAPGRGEAAGAGAGRGRVASPSPTAEEEIERGGVAPLEGGGEDRQDQEDAEAEEGVLQGADATGGRSRRKNAGGRGDDGAAEAAAAGYGAYGSAGGEADAAAEGGGELAAATAALARIRQAMNGPQSAQQPQQSQGGAEEGAEQRSQTEEEPDPSLKDELLVWVAVCGPGQTSILHEEFLMLGSHTLAQLRDVMGCATEDAMREAAEAATTATAAPVADAEAAAPVAAAAAAGREGRGGGGRRGARGGRSRGGRGAKVVADAAPSPPAAAAAASPRGDSAAAAGGSTGGGVGVGDGGGGSGCSAEVLPPSHGSYLFMEGRFFRDVRHPEAQDYSEPIRTLCRTHGVWPMMLRPDRSWRPGLVRDSGHEPREPAAMHETRVAELTVRQANHPTALFCHRACCEHLVFVRDVRRWHPGDPPRRAAYPLRLRCRDRAGVPVARRRCGLCEARFAELVTHDDPLAPSNPAIMCRHCFDLLHVGSNGERLQPDVVVQPYNPALDIAAQGVWAPSAGTWALAVAAAAAGGPAGAADKRPNSKVNRLAVALTRMGAPGARQAAEKG